VKKNLIVFGTRPEAIKMAPLIKKFSENKEDFDTKVCVTAQHRKLLDQVLDVFQIVPDFDLNIMKPGQDLFDITANVLTGMREVLTGFGPDIVFVHGDTTTSFTAALAAFYLNMKVAHVEAGLRTYNLAAPWPEEANRQLTGRIAGYHFAPTDLAREHLLSEGTPDENILVTGNTVIDALNWVVNKNGEPEVEEKLRNRIKAFGYPINGKKIILITTHRRENFGEGFRNICNAIRVLSEKYPGIDFVLPVHLNPNVRSVVYGLLSEVKNVYLIEPVEYQPFVYLMAKSEIILTDSGGIQEEAPSLGKPVLVMREKTERSEAVEAGTVKLVGTDPVKIVEETIELLENTSAYENMTRAHNPYGDGRACERIVDFVRNQV
jgi:UDP-N-acetylglucosamine 2-epimerase (non-hydrolysing)